MKNNFKILLVFILLNLIIILSSCKLSGRDDSSDLKDSPPGIVQSEIERGFYRGGAVLFSPQDLDFNMLTIGQFFTMKLGKFEITEELLEENLNNGNPLVGTDESIVSDKFTSTSEAYYSILISSISLQRISLTVFKWSGSGFKDGTIIELDHGQQYDIDADGFPDIEWISGDPDRGLEINSRYLSFICSYENRYTTMYQMREQWTPLGYFPYGIISISPYGNILINDSILSNIQRPVFDAVTNYLESGSLPSNLSNLEQSASNLIAFLQPGDIIYKTIEEVTDGISEQLFYIRKTSSASHSRSLNNRSSTVEEMSLEELEADDANYLQTLEDGLLDTYDYTEDYDVDESGNAVLSNLHSNNDRTVLPRATGSAKISSTYNIDMAGYGSLILESGIKFKIKVSFKKWWVGSKATVAIKSTPFFSVQAEIDSSSTTDSGTITLDEIQLFQGVRIPLGAFPGTVTIGKTYLTPRFNVGAGLNGKIQYDYSKTYESRFRFKAGRKNKKWYGSSKYLGTEEIDQTNIVTIPSFPTVPGTFSFDPKLTFEINMRFVGILKPYIDYNLESLNEAQFTETGVKLNSSVIGYATSGIEFGMKKTFKIKVGFIKVKRTIGFSKTFSFGRIKGTSFDYSWLEDYFIQK